MKQRNFAKGSMQSTSTIMSRKHLPTAHRGERHTKSIINNFRNMKQVADIQQLKPGQELIRVLNGEVHYYEFLMIHPHNPEYIFCMNFCKRAERFYKSEVYKQFFTDYTDRDLINVRRDYALKTLKECDMALKELGDKDNLKE